MEQDVPRDSPVAGRRFLADAMLERLARWLRVLGFDVASAGTLVDGELLRRAAAEDRVLLTRDRGLLGPERASDYLIESSDPLEQLREVVARFELPLPPELFTRCLLCNTVLQPLGRALDDDDELPLDVRERGEALRQCTTCGRVYWEGAHTRRMRAALARALPGLPQEPPPGS